ncbi:MAG TPA: hypothetical protein VJL81_04835 [Solirubrobacterales bacterium]|nr:hypothetical protein [Solirubrobacterales bacterium]
MVALLAVLGIRAATAAAAPLGMQYSETYSKPEDLAVIGKSGAKLLRLPVLPEFSSNGENFSGYDTTFEAAAKAGVRIQVVLHGHTGKGTSFPNAEEQPAWSEFARKAVRRYGYNGVFWSTHPGVPYLPVQEWELWNEPNAGTNPSNAAAVGTQYGGFLGWAGPVVQSTSESFGGQPTRVLIGGLLSFYGAPTEESFGTFLAAAIKASGKTAFTGAGFHPYGLGAANRLEALQNAVNAMRADLTAASSSAKALAITEFGWPVEREPAYAITESAAATSMKQCVNWLNANEASLNLTAIDYYNYRDSAFGTNWAYRSGLRDEVGNFRKAWFAFEELQGVPRWPTPTVALQANTSQLFTWTRGGGAVNTLYGMAAGTSPAVGQVSGTYDVAFQANTGTLWIYNPASGGVNTGYGMAAGTSPAIAQLESGAIAFQSNAHQLWLYVPGGEVINSEYAMEPGTSPAITRKYNGNYVVAYHGSDGTLHVWEPHASQANTGIALEPGSSPAVTATDHEFGESSYYVAVNRLGGELTFYNEAGATTLSGYGMAAHASPGIASIASGAGRFETPFQANTGQLWLYMPFGTVASTGYGMAAGTAPSVVGFSEGSPTAAAPVHPFEIAFQTNASQMWSYEPEGLITNSLLGMAAGTSPGIGPG